MKNTSLNVNELIFEQIEAISQKFNISKKQIISEIFIHCHNNLNFNKIRTKNLICYQKKHPDNSWKCLRIDLNEMQCDLYQMYRNQFRISLSKLLAVGFYLFFNLIIAKLSENSQKKNVKIQEIMYSYTKTKQLIVNFVKDFFNFFNILDTKT